MTGLGAVGQVGNFLCLSHCHADRLDVLCHTLHFLKRRVRNWTVKLEADARRNWTVKLEVDARRNWTVKLEVDARRNWTVKLEVDARRNWTVKFKVDARKTSAICIAGLAFTLTALHWSFESRSCCVASEFGSWGPRGTEVELLKMSRKRSGSKKGSHKSSSRSSSKTSAGSSSSSKRGRSASAKDSSRSKETVKSVFKDYGGEYKFKLVFGLSPHSEDGKVEARNIAKGFADASNDANGR